MASFKLENTGASWPDETVDVQGKVDQMIIQENQKAVNVKRFKKHLKSKQKPIWRIEKSNKRSRAVSP